MQKIERDFEINEILKDLDCSPHEIYRGIDYTFATKFRLFYKGELKVPDVPLNRFGFVSRKPIARCIQVEQMPTCNGRIDIPVRYKLGLSKNWKRQVDKMYTFFQETPIREVHVDEDISIIKNLFIQVAKKFGVNTFVHMHGALGQRHGFLPLTADYMVVWDSRNKSKLISWGLEENRIIVGGYEERYSPIKNSLNPSLIDSIRDDLKLDEHPILLFAPYTFTNYGDGSEKEIRHGIWMIQEAIRRLSPLNKYNLIVKLHPSSKDLPYWKWWCKYSDVDCIVIKDYNPYKLIYSSEKIIVQSSTLAIDGLVIGKQVIVIDSGFSTGVEEYYGDPCLIRASTVKDIVNSI